MYIDNQWELIGSTTIDLSDYVTETELTTALTPYVQTSALTTTLDDRYVNVTGDTMTGLLTASTHGIKITNVSDQYRNITVKAYAGYVDNYDEANPRLLLDDDGGTGNVVISGVATPKDNTDAANKYYVDNKVAGISIPTITPVAALTAGITIGSIDINGTTTTFYTSEDTKVKQNDITGSTTITGQYPILLSSQDRNAGTITDETFKKGNFGFNNLYNVLIISGDGTNQNGGFYVNDNTSRYNQASLMVMTAGTTSTTGLVTMQLGNQHKVPEPGNAKGQLVMCGEGNWHNIVYALDNRTTDDTNHNYVNYFPMTDGVLAAGVTTGVGSSTVPVYMAAGGELLACTLPTPTTYTMSMTGPTINLLADGVAASTITLPIWDGTLD